MVEKLVQIGKPVSWERVQHFAAEGSIGRPHIALALIEAGHVASVGEDFGDRRVGFAGHGGSVRDVTDMVTV